MSLSTPILTVLSCARAGVANPAAAMSAAQHRANVVLMENPPNVFLRRVAFSSEPPQRLDRSAHPFSRLIGLTPQGNALMVASEVGLDFWIGLRRFPFAGSTPATQ